MKEILCTTTLIMLFSLMASASTDPKSKVHPAASGASAEPTRTESPETAKKNEELDKSILKSVGEDSEDGKDLLKEFVDDTLGNHGDDFGLIGEQLDELITKSNNPEELLKGLKARYPKQEKLSDVIEAKGMKTEDLLAKDKLTEVEAMELKRRVDRFAELNETSYIHAKKFMRDYYAKREAYDDAVKATEADKKKYGTVQSDTFKRLVATREQLADLTMRNALTRTKDQAKDFKTSLQGIKGFFRKQNGSLERDLNNATVIRMDLKGFGISLEKKRDKEPGRLWYAMYRSATSGETARQSKEFWGRISALESSLKRYNTAVGGDKESARVDLLAKSSNFREYQHTLHPWVQSLKARADKDPEAKRLAERVESLYGLIGGKGHGEITIAGTTTVINSRYDLNKFFQQTYSDPKQRRQFRNLNYQSAFSFLQKKSDRPAEPSRRYVRSTKGSGTPDFSHFTFHSLLKKREEAVKEIEKGPGSTVSANLQRLQRIRRELDQRIEGIDSVPISVLEEEQNRRLNESIAATAGSMNRPIHLLIPSFAYQAWQLQKVHSEGKERLKAVSTITSIPKWSTREGKPLAHEELLKIIFDAPFSARKTNQRLRELRKHLR